MRWRFNKQPIRHGHTRDVLQCAFGDPGEYSEIGIGNGALERDEVKDLEMAEPAQAGDIVVLDSIVR